MEATKRSSGIENLETPEKEHNEYGKEQGDSSRQRRGSRRTRSQAAPDWSTMDSLILVNEIAAVEADCKEALSSYQKWKIIADNCTVLDVVRNSNQCHRQWDSLFAEYNLIKKWETQLGSESYWSLGRERRKELGILEDFDNELFDAIDNLVRAQEDRLDTDPDSDPEAVVETVDVFAEFGMLLYILSKYILLNLFNIIWMVSHLIGNLVYLLIAKTSDSGLFSLNCMLSTIDFTAK